MTSTSVRPSSYNQPSRDPNTAAVLSLFIPGLGQMYNGETRKGMLFVCVAVLNLILFLAMCFNTQILEAMLLLGQQFHMKPNKMLLIALQQAHLGSPVFFILVGFFLSYVFYAVRDAYDHAALKRRRIYPDFVIELPEATSGSYIFHFSIMVALFIIAFFFIIPPMPKSQLTEIEFIDPQLQVKQIKHKKPVPRSIKTSVAGGKRDITKPVHVSKPAGPKSPAAPAKEPAKTPAPQKPQQQPAKAPTPPTPHQAPPAPTPKPMATPAPPTPHMAAPAPTPTPRPMPAPMRLAQAPSPAAPTPMHMAAPAPSPSMMPRPTAMAAPSAATPMPMAAAPKAMSPSLLPAALAPSTLARSGAGAGAMPTPMARPNGGGGVQGLPSLAPSPISIGSGGGSGGGMSNFAPLARAGSGSGGGGGFSGAVGPVAASSGGGSSRGGGSAGGSGPVPVAMSGGGGSGHGSGSSGGSGAPAPVRAGRGSGGGGGWSSGPISISPSVPKGGGGGGGGPSNAGGGKGPASQAAQADVDFGPYMADLQRRIKRAWFPPRGQESRKVVVIFKIHSQGELSDLRIERGSGVALADQAALAAVQNAAPFRPLPAGAPAVVDIQFTFDYNVFSGGRSF